MEFATASSSGVVRELLVSPLPPCIGGIQVDWIDPDKTEKKGGVIVEAKMGRSNIGRETRKTSEKRVFTSQLDRIDENWKYIIPLLMMKNNRALL